MERVSPFDSIESAQEFVDLLAETILEARQQIEADMAELDGEDRRLDALRLTGFKLDKLLTHMNGSRRILTDLRTLRRLLLNERKLRVSAASDAP